MNVMVFLKKIKPKWKYDAAVTISLFALFVSGTQLIVTVPLFTKFFFSPKLVMTCSGTSPDADTLAGVCYVSNEGNVQATKIEIGMQVEVNQRLTFMPNLTSNVIEEKKPIFLKNVKIEVERLLPGEKFQIIVLPGPNCEKIRSDVAKHFIESGIKEIPIIGFFRSAEGIGKLDVLSKKKPTDPSEKL